jgi:hypothetical protein
MAEEQGTAAAVLFQPHPASSGWHRSYVLSRLAAKVVCAPNGCWEWCGSRLVTGYGKFEFKRRIILAHRAAWELCFGPIPGSLWVLHSCDNPPCCRPGHLFLGTHADNMADMVAKGRKPRGCYIPAEHRLRGEKNKNAKLTSEMVMDMRRREAAGESPDSIAAATGVIRRQVSAVVTGKAWAHLPLAYTGDRWSRQCPKCGCSVTTRRGRFYKHVAECRMGSTF